VATAQLVLFDPSPDVGKPNVPSQHQVESFRIERRTRVLVRSALRRNGSFVDSTVSIPEGMRLDSDLAGAFDWAWLRCRVPPPRVAGKQVRIVDLFSGCGVMSLGLDEACRALGFTVRPLLAVDVDEVALRVYARNFTAARTHCGPVEDLLDSGLQQKLSGTEKELKKALGRVDVLVGGPPCQGHSDLNNHTRRQDPKNALFSKMARFAEVCEPEHIIVENVRGILHDRGRVFARTHRRLEALGYKVTAGVLEGEKLGVAQSRHRVFMVASLAKSPSLTEIAVRFRVATRPVSWAIKDLASPEAESDFDVSSTPAEASVRRIRYLFEHGLYDLPNTHRPKCHKLKDHSYRSVYGRLHWDQPAQTITTGFCSMGQGRFVHPSRRRTLTPHEAARIQFIPDFFTFPGVKRAALARMIGNAVPPKLTYVVALDLLR
jgi:DNA (cytosine-5)-methyltransferase 1